MLQAFPLCLWTAGQEVSRIHWSVVDHSQMEPPSLTVVALAHCRNLVEAAALHTQASPVVRNILVAEANMALVACYSLEWLHKKAGLDRRAGHAVFQAWAHEASCSGFPWHLPVNPPVALPWRAKVAWKERLDRGGPALGFAQGVEDYCRPLPLGSSHWEEAHQWELPLGWAIPDHERRACSAACFVVEVLQVFQAFQVLQLPQPSLLKQWLKVVFAHEVVGEHVWAPTRPWQQLHAQMLVQMPSTEALALPRGHPMH